MTPESLPTDVILLRCSLASDEGLAAAAGRWFAGSGLPLLALRIAWSQAQAQAYVYGRLAERRMLAAEALAPLAAQWRALCPQAAALDVARLEQRLDVVGHSQGAAPTHHYVVETDPEDGWDEEIARWYDTEHMPGLAAVPGCIHARRFINHDAGPRSLACYDLSGEATLGSARWLAVRGTEWSSRARPHFTNTRRTMMQFVA